MSKQRWVCYGDVRGQCSRRHRTQSAALDHCIQDNRGAKEACGPAGYSDRQPHLENCWRVTSGGICRCHEGAAPW